MLRKCCVVGLHVVDVAIIRHLHPFRGLLLDGVLGVPCGACSFTPCTYVLDVYHNHIGGRCLSLGVVGTLIGRMAGLITVKTSDRCRRAGVTVLERGWC